MGLALDSSTLIAAEREKRSISQILLSLEANHTETQVILSSVTVMELEHGWHRAQNSEIALQRRRYLEEIFAVIPVEPFTRGMGVLAAKVDAETRRIGRVIATADLLIGVTALYYGYSIGTRNVRHFQMIPGLNVVQL